MQEIFDSLGIDFKQLITTVFGFAIFFWIMKKFAFGPFMQLLEDRRETISSTFQRLEDERREIDESKAEYRNLIDNIADERHKQLQEGLQEAKKLAADVQQEARGKAENIIRRAEESAAREIAQAKVELKNYMVDLSIQSAELALKETITDEGHRRIIRKYIEELGSVETGRSEV
ncbi:MAG: F0F1 ATP synthase subunit B [bacterium]